MTPVPVSVAVDGVMVVGGAGLFALAGLVRPEAERRPMTPVEAEVVLALRRALAVVFERDDTSDSGRVGQASDTRSVMLCGVQEVAARLGIGSRSVTRNAQRWGARKVGRVWVFPADDVDRVAADRGVA